MGKAAEENNLVTIELLLRKLKNKLSKFGNDLIIFNMFMKKISSGRISSNTKLLL